MMTSGLYCKCVLQLSMVTTVSYDYREMFL